MNRKEFLEKCEEHEMYIADVWDVGSIVHSQRSEEAWFIYELCGEDWWVGANPHHPSMSFLAIDEEALDESDDAEDLANLMHDSIVHHRKFNYIAKINMPKKTYLGDDTWASGGGWQEICVCYGDTMEEIWGYAVEFAEEKAQRALDDYNEKQGKK